MPRLTKATAPSAKQAAVVKSVPPPSAPRTPQAVAQRSSVVQEAPSALPPPEQCRPADTDDFDFIESLSQTPAAPRPKAKPAPPRATSKSAKPSVSPRNSSGDVPPPPPASTATAKPGGRKTAPKTAPAKGSGKKTAPPTPAKGKAKSAAPAPKKATAARAPKRSRSPTECETPPPPPDAPLLSQSMSAAAAGSAGGSPLPCGDAAQAATQEGADGERSPKLSQVCASQEHRSEEAAASPFPGEGSAGSAVGRLSQELRPSGPLPPGPDAEYDAALAEVSEGTATAALRLQIERYQRFLQQYARKKEAAAVRPARFRYWCNFLDAERDKGNDKAFFGGSSPARKSKGE